MQTSMKRIALVLAVALPLSAHAAADAEWTFGANGVVDYTLTAVSSTDLFAGALPANDPAISLAIGKRYRVTVLDPSFHPLEIIAKSTSPFSDIILLSQAPGITGNSELDPEIGWQELGGGVVEFTLTPTLAELMAEGSRVPGYRCALHEGSMRGNFTIATTGPTPTPSPTPVPTPSNDPAVVFANLTEQHWAPFAIPAFFRAPEFSSADGLGYTITTGAPAFGWWETRESLTPLPAGLYLLTLQLATPTIVEGTRQPEVRVRLFNADNSFTAMAVTAQSGDRTVRNMVEVPFRSDGTSPFRLAVDLLVSAPDQAGGATITSIMLEPIGTHSGH